jgi:hypothetical protein
MKKLLLAFAFATLALCAHAQESACGDGVDNDGDGLIDCFDKDCAGNLSCKDFYVGHDIDCQITPPSGVAFAIKKSASSPDRTTWSSGRIDVGDLDGDGIPEVITHHPEDKKLYILDGRDLSIKYTGAITNTPEYYDHAIGNIDGDKCSEIFIVESDGSNFYISSYDCKATLLWTKKAFGRPFNIGLADFDSDGKAELYYRNEILDAKTGTRLIKGSGSWNAIDAGPVAVDIVPNATCTTCDGLELVLGGNIYAVDFGTRAADAGTLSLVKSIPSGASYYPKYSSFGYVTSATSVADFNQDGSLDVLTSGSIGSTTGTTAVFFWDVKNDDYKVYKPSTDWQHGTGRLNIADIDGDGKLNTTFVSGSMLYALKEDFSLLWSINISENTSGFTGATVFDFNNDRAVEVVYRDEASLYIINGKDGTFLTSVTCHSRTANDYPIVADVDGDGSTEICVSCNTKDTDKISDISTAPYGQVRVYESNLSPWVPARKVWNQHGYFNVNINDDLTIPKVQQKQEAIFSTNTCTTGANRALNTFLNQSPFLDSKGCPTYAAPDIAFASGVNTTVNQPTCPDQNFTISFTIQNVGDNGLAGSLPITFYQGDPTKPGAVKLNTETISLSNFNVNDKTAVSNLTVKGYGSAFTLYIVLNDNGSSNPISLPNTSFKECNYTNNILSVSVTPKPFPLQASLISDDIRCTNNNTTPHNGAVEAYRLNGTTKETVGYTFYWFNGTTAGDTTTAAFKGPVYTGLAAGTYTVVAMSKGAKCFSTSAQVVVGQKTKDITAVISEDRPYTNCKNPDGKLSVSVNNGEPTGNFTYEWFEGNVFGTSPVLSKSHILTNVDAVTYSVLVTEKATGCQILTSAKVADQTVKPVVTASSTLANCNPSNTGTASASVGGKTSGFTFYWYDGNAEKPSPDFTGSTYSSLNPGTYTVTAFSTSSGCTSLPVQVTVGSVTASSVTATVVSQQTSCSTPTGSASASVGGTTTGYSFKWYKGNNTLAANLIASTSTVTKLAAGVYTVEATKTSTGCVDTDIVTITDNITYPSVTPSVVSHQTFCTSFNGSVKATATGGSSFVYYWFNGNVGTPDTLAANFKGATYSGLKAGYYTVVAVNKTTRCPSSAQYVEVLDKTVLPAITTSTLDQKSCNSSTPNGQVSANVGGATAGYSFAWYNGSGTGGSSAGNTATVSSLPAGTYTVKVTTTATGCFSTATISVVNNTVTPVASAKVDQQLTLCSSNNGQVSASVGGTTTGL